MASEDGDSCISPWWYAAIAAFLLTMSLESYILHQNHYQIELLTNLDRVPEYGALVVVTFPKVKDGSGFPARVFAILPYGTGDRGRG